MSVWVAYLTVLIIWSTTPLAISWSNDSFGPMAALSLRLLVSLVIVVVIRLLAKSPPMDYANNWKAYASGAIGLFPCMALVYWSADFIPSSLISVLFGLSPFAILMLNAVMSSGVGVSQGQFLGMVIAFFGLAGVMLPGETSGSVSLIGIGLLLGSVLVYAISTLLVKNHAMCVHIPNQLFGTLLFAAPFFLFLWAFEGFAARDSISTRAVLATLYLGAMGSVVGFLAYFYLLKRISVAAVSLIPMVTPVIAVVLGVWLNAEVLSLFVYFGIGLILLGLWLFRYSEKRAA